MITCLVGFASVGSPALLSIGTLAAATPVLHGGVPHESTCTTPSALPGAARDAAAFAASATAWPLIVAAVESPSVNT